LGTHLVPAQLKQDVRVVGVVEKVFELDDIRVVQRLVDLDL
jgi:hypothetical protein